MLPESSSDPAAEKIAPARSEQTQRTPLESADEDRSRASNSAASESPDALVTAQSLYSVAGSEKAYAEGGMGTILLAQDETLARTVVLKILLEKHKQNPQLCHRFRREAAITAQLQHPGVPPVFGAGTLTDARPFFSMKLVVGRTLAQLLSESVDDPRDRPRFLTIFEQVCQTVAFAHARGVIHRDLKPENIVVGEYGSVYVMDWGIARMLSENGKEGVGVEGMRPVPLNTEDTEVWTEHIGDSAIAEAESSITIPGDLLGTPQYMSPEQARGDSDQDERTDVFSLGAILFEIMTGQPLR
jgi:eukaryotic-like serine/threonine-protein kinase